MVIELKDGMLVTYSSPELTVTLSYNKGIDGKKVIDTDKVIGITRITHNGIILFSR
jgi:hypothetical protein